MNEAREEAITFLRSIVSDEKAEQADRMKAAELVLLHTDNGTDRTDTFRTQEASDRVSE
jgi:hypothetical protein